MRIVRAMRPICSLTMATTALSFGFAGPSAAQSPGVVACASADLALMEKLNDDSNPKDTPATRLAEAVLRMVEARSACLDGEFARGLALYNEAALLSGGSATPDLAEQHR
jgi:hypothetical protein